MLLERCRSVTVLVLITVGSLASAIVPSSTRPLWPRQGAVPLGDALLAVMNAHTTGAPSLFASPCCTFEM